MSNESKSLPPAFASQPAALLVVSRMDPAILHTVSLDASEPMILTSIVDANATKLSVPAAVVVSKDEVLPMQTDTKSAPSSVREVEKVEVKVLQPEEQYNRGGAEQDPRIQLHREDVVTDVEGEISALKPTEPVSVEQDRVAKFLKSKNFIKMQKMEKLMIMKLVQNKMTKAMRK